jgi:cytochrome c oxidase subunit II
MLDPDAFGTPFDAHSPETRAIASLFTETLLVCAVIFVVVTGLVGYCVVRFRARPGDAEPRQIDGHRRLEILWTIIPCLIVLGLFGLTDRAMALSDAPPDRDPDIVIIGHQWWWEARYPNGAVTANEIHIPAGKDLVVRVESADVIHDFWAPRLGRKVDATPGHPVTIQIQSDTPGLFHGACAEYCGAQHAWMRFDVIAESSRDFETWVAHQASGAGPLPSVPAAFGTPSDDPIARGAKLFAERTCVDCHAVRGHEPDGRKPATVAPDLTHFASRRSLGAGVLPNTSSDLFVWLKYPQSVKPGCHMPSLRLSNAEAEDLVAYLEVLQ